MIVATSLSLSCRNSLQPLFISSFATLWSWMSWNLNTVAHPSEMNRSEAPAGITAGASAVPMSDFAPRWMPSR